MRKVISIILRFDTGEEVYINEQDLVKFQVAVEGEELLARAKRFAEALR